MRVNRRMFGRFEAIFDAGYLFAAAALGVYMLIRATSPTGVLAGWMALVLAGGDAFHLVPRIAASASGDEARYRRALGFGKFITSVTMTAFYVMLWYVGTMLFPLAWAPALAMVVWALAAVRVALCLPRANGWFEEEPPVTWAIYRNIPFLLLGIMVAALFGVSRAQGFSWMWLAIALSFGFYLPVVVGSNRHRMLGILMIPKTLAYVWMLAMCAAALA